MLTFHVVGALRRGPIADMTHLGGDLDEPPPGTVCLKDCKPDLFRCLLNYL
jgi:hypothetical protein